MREAHGEKSPAPAWIPQIDAEDKQDVAEAQSVTCDQSRHLLLTNYQLGTICYRQGRSDGGREGFLGWRTTQAISLFRYNFKKSHT